jgi:hypothetical protein
LITITRSEKSWAWRRSHGQGNPRLPTRPAGATPSFPPPALGERGQRGLARRLVAVGWRAILKLRHDPTARCDWNKSIRRSDAARVVDAQALGGNSAAISGIVAEQVPLPAAEW